MSNKKLKNLGETHSSNIFGTGKSHLNQTSKKSQEATNTVLHSFTKLNSPSHQSLAPYQSHSNFEGFPTINTDKNSRRKEGLRNSYHNSHITSPQNDLMNIMNVNEIALATNHYIDTSTLSQHKSKIEIDINEDLNFSVEKRERQTMLLPSFKDKQMRLDQSLVTSSAMNKSSVLESDPQFRVGWPKT
jgi:ATP-dependent Lon protease